MSSNDIVSVKTCKKYLEFILDATEDVRDDEFKSHLRIFGGEDCRLLPRATFLKRPKNQSPVEFLEQTITKTAEEICGQGECVLHFMVIHSKNVTTVTNRLVSLFPRPSISYPVFITISGFETVETFCSSMNLLRLHELAMISASKNQQ